MLLEEDRNEKVIYTFMTTCSGYCLALYVGAARLHSHNIVYPECCSLLCNWSPFPPFWPLLAPCAPQNQFQNPLCIWISGWLCSTLPFWPTVTQVCQSNALSWPKNWIKLSRIGWVGFHTRVKLCNKLPLYFRQAPLLSVFKSLYKTYLLGLWQSVTCWLLWLKFCFCFFNLCFRLYMGDPGNSSWHTMTHREPPL